MPAGRVFEVTDFEFFIKIELEPFFQASGSIFYIKFRASALGF